MARTSTTASMASAERRMSSASARRSSALPGEVPQGYNEAMAVKRLSLNAPKTLAGLASRMEVKGELDTRATTPTAAANSARGARSASGAGSTRGSGSSAGAGPLSALGDREDPVRARAWVVFKTLDGNGDGVLTRAEVAEALVRNGVCDAAGGAAMIASADESEDDVVSFDEFLQQWRRELLKSKLTMNEKLKHMIAVFSEGLNVSEELRQVGESTWMIHPLSSSHAFWDLFIASILIVTVVTLPLTMAFTHLNERFHYANLAFDVLFCCDIAKTFATGFVRNDIVVMDFATTTKRYVYGPFVFDVIASFPLDTVVEGFMKGRGNASQLTRSTRVIKMLRLLRLTKVFRLLRVTRAYAYARELQVQLEERHGLHFHPAVFKLSKLFAALLLAAHWMGCVNWLIVESFDYPEDSWALTMMLLMDFGIATPVATHCESISAACTVESWVVVLSMWVGALFYGILIGALAEVLQSMNISGRAYQDHLQAVTEYLRVNKIPGDLNDRVQDFFYQQYTQGKIFPEGRARLPVAADPVDGGKAFQLQLVKHLHDHFVFSEDRILEERTFGDYMYFVASGVVAITSMHARKQHDQSAGGACVAAIGDGCFFGEVALLLGIKRTASALAITSCRLLAVDEGGLERTLRNHPAIAARLERVARDRAARMMNLNPHYSDPDFHAGEDREDTRTAIFKRGEERLRDASAKHLVDLDPDVDKALHGDRRGSLETAAGCVSPRELAKELEGLLGDQSIYHEDLAKPSKSAHHRVKKQVVRPRKSINQKARRRGSKPGTLPRTPSAATKTKGERMFAMVQRGASLRHVKTDVDGDGDAPPLPIQRGRSGLARANSSMAPLQRGKSSLGQRRRASHTPASLNQFF
ncbi:voltage-gated potassium channel [Aureococcus anophagefferens]|nr:voltage-gated potassium channel [Aureococcus anophagefferens]